MFLLFILRERRIKRSQFHTDKILFLAGISVRRSAPYYLREDDSATLIKQISY